jgi:S1-C subfamily serine protease
MSSVARWFKGLGPTQRGLVLFFLGVICTSGVVGLGAISIIVAGASPTPSPSTFRDTTPSALPYASSTPALSPTAAVLTLAEVATRGARSTVVIGVVRGYRDIGSGTGVVLDGGRVITNAHVVRGALQLAVFTSDGNGRSAQILGVDTQRDLALLQVNDAQGLTPAVLGDSTRLEVLDDVVAVGYPVVFRFDDLAPTSTRGTVSKVSAVVEGLTFIQHEAAINPGNSGGPLFNSRAEVVGINTLRFFGEGAGERGRPVTGINFAIPIQEVKARLSSSGAARRALSPAGCGRAVLRARLGEGLFSSVRELLRGVSAANIVRIVY